MKKAIAFLLIARLCLPACALAANTTNPAEIGRDLSSVIGTVIIANGNSAHVRLGPSVDTQQIGAVNPGEQYDCVGVAGNGWYEIIYPTGQNGFISNKLAVLERGVYSPSVFSYPVGTVRITSDGAVKTFNGGGTEYHFMGSVQSGQVYPCVGISRGGWYAIVVTDGWIVYVSPSRATLSANQFVQPNEIPQSVILTGLDCLGLVTVTNDRVVNVRMGGGEEWPIISQIYPGEMFSYIGKADSGWIGLVLPDGTVGYASPKLVTATTKQ